MFSGAKTVSSLSLLCAHARFFFSLSLCCVHVCEYICIQPLYPRTHTPTNPLPTGSTILETEQGHLSFSLFSTCHQVFVKFTGSKMFPFRTIIMLRKECYDWKMKHKQVPLMMHNVLVLNTFFTGQNAHVCHSFAIG